MTYILINEQLIPATITGMLHDASWDDRSSKSITIEMSYNQAMEIFVNDVQWSIVEFYSYEELITEENGETQMVTKEQRLTHDNSEYSIAGDIIDHRNGYVTVKMGKPTAEEILAILTEGLSL